MPERVNSSRHIIPEDLIRGTVDLSVGANVGAVTLKEQMIYFENDMLGSLTTGQWGKATCYENVSGDLLSPEFVGAARDLEV